MTNDSITPLPDKGIPARDRLIVALDLTGPAEARRFVEQLGDAVGFYKIGLELFMAGGYWELADWLTARGKKVFADLKIFDVPETVRAAVHNVAGRGVHFTTVRVVDPMTAQQVVGLITGMGFGL